MPQTEPPAYIIQSEAGEGSLCRILISMSIKRVDRY